MVLRPKANASDLTGQLDLPRANGQIYLTFHYSVVRVWQESVEDLLAAGPGIAALALLTNEAAEDLPAAFARFRECLRTQGVAANVESGLLGSAFVLCGLRYSPNQIENLYRDLSMTLEDSTTYQLILNKGLTQGRAEEARRLLLRLGVKRFGPVPASVEVAIQAIAAPDRIERMVEGVIDATGWDDLIATP